MNNVVEEIYKIENDVFGMPQEYKGVKFHPIRIKDVNEKKMLYRLFFQSKNYISQREIVKMSYFKFLMYVVNNNIKENVYTELVDLLNHITKVDKKNISIRIEDHPENNEIFNRTMLYLQIGDTIFDENEFDNIREILLEQSGYSIEWVESFDLSLEDKIHFMNRANEDIDFKDEIFSFCAMSGISESEAGEKTLYQFKNRLEREMVMKDYDNFKQLEVSGQISSKAGGEIFKHYLSHIPKPTRYGSILIDKDSFIEKSGLGGADKNGNINT